MKMVIGGAYQGKTDYAKQAYPNLVWSDGASCDLKEGTVRDRDQDQVRRRTER